MNKQLHSYYSYSTPFSTNSCATPSRNYLEVQGQVYQAENGTAGGREEP